MTEDTPWTANDTPESPVAPAPVVGLQIATVAKLNLADFQNAVPALRELAIVNETSTAISELTLSVASEPAFLKPRTWSLETVGAGETCRLSDLDVQLDGALLFRLSEAEPSTLRFELRSASPPPRKRAARSTGPRALLPGPKFRSGGQTVTKVCGAWRRSASRN